MMADFISRFLLLVFGYAYPAFQCFKTVEKNRVDIEELRFWCQYWIILVTIAVLEKVTDFLLFWFPMYNELKLAFVIYLWHPKSKGTGYIYETILQPLVANYETDIDRKLLELKARAWDLVIDYSHNGAVLGKTAFFRFLQSLITHSTNNRQTSDMDDSQYETPRYMRHSRSGKHSPPSSPSASFIHHAMSNLSKVDVVAQHPDKHPEYVLIEEDNPDGTISRPNTPRVTPSPESPSYEKLRSPSLRHRTTSPLGSRNTAL